MYSLSVKRKEGNDQESIQIPNTFRPIKVKKGLPLETKNTQNHENMRNMRIGLIESLHMQHCCLQSCIRPSAIKAVFDFQNTQDGLNDPKRNKT